MASLKEPLVTLGLIVAILLFHMKPGQFRFLLPSVSEASHRTCTSMRGASRYCQWCNSEVLVKIGLQGVEISQWPLFLFHHANKGHLAFDMLSFLWKGTLLEGCIGSRQFAAMVFTLLFTCGGLLIMTGAVLQVLGVADLYPSMCQVGLPGLHFALSFILSSKHERYRFIIPIHYQNLYRVIIPANYAVELALVYFLCPGLLFSSPFCGTVAGFLYSHGPQLRSSLNSWLHLNRRWLCPLTKISRTSEQEQFMETTGLIWRCHACTYDNSSTTDPYSCAICEALRFQFFGSTEMQENPDSAGLVWSCPACTLVNGVFLHECEICGTPRPVFGIRSEHQYHFIHTDIKLLQKQMEKEWRMYNVSSATHCISGRVIMSRITGRWFLKKPEFYCHEFEAVSKLLREATILGFPLECADSAREIN